MNISDYKKYISSEFMMGPNSVRVLEELFGKYPLQLTSDDLIFDLGCGKGLTMVVFQISNLKEIIESQELRSSSM